MLSHDQSQFSCTIEFRRFRAGRFRSAVLDPVALLANLAVERDRSRVRLDSELLLENFGANTELPQRCGVPALLAIELHQTAMHALTQRIEPEQLSCDRDTAFDGVVCHVMSKQL